MNLLHEASIHEIKEEVEEEEVVKIKEKTKTKLLYKDIKHVRKDNSKSKTKHAKGRLNRKKEYLNKMHVQNEHAYTDLDQMWWDNHMEFIDFMYSPWGDGDVYV